MTVFFCSSWTCVISQVGDTHCPISDGPNKTPDVSVTFAACDPLVLPARLGANRDSTLGGFFMPGSAVRWISSLLIPPLFPRPTTRRGPRPGPHKDPVCQICDITPNLCPPRTGSLPAPSPAPLRESLVFSHRDDNWDGEGGNLKRLYNVQRGEESDLRHLCPHCRGRELSGKIYCVISQQIGVLLWETNIFMRLMILWRQKQQYHWMS